MVFNNGFIIIYGWLDVDISVPANSESSYSFTYPISVRDGGITVPMAIGTGDKVIFGSKTRQLSHWEIYMRNVHTTNTNFHGLGVIILGY